MKKLKLYLLSFLCTIHTFGFTQAQVSSKNYLEHIKTELSKEWPKNRTINIVFHGHSVPAGYFKTPIVNTLEAYPMQVLHGIKSSYPYAVVNCINTAIGGENSISGAKRFKKEVLNHQPDVLFIDYALNDRRIGLEAANKAWTKMIKLALKKEIKVILLSPTPDTKVDLLVEDSILDQHRIQIKALSLRYGIGFIDSYGQFKKLAEKGESISDYMSQGNHPNTKGHSLVAKEILQWF